MNRGAEAYRQAYQYIAENNPWMSRTDMRGIAYWYLRTTAAPPLTLRERLSARLEWWRHR